MKTTTKKSGGITAVDLLKAFGVSFPDEKQKEEIQEEKVKYRTALNSVFDTEYGHHVIVSMVKWSKYWDSLFKYKPEDRGAIHAQHEMIRALVFKHLTKENVTKLIMDTRGE